MKAGRFPLAKAYMIIDALGIIVHSINDLYDLVNRSTVNEGTPHDKEHSTADEIG